MFFKKHKQNTSPANSQTTIEEAIDVITKAFGYSLGETYPHGLGEITAMTKSITDMFEIIDHSPYAASWSTEQSMYATALCYMYPFIRLNSKAVGPTYNAVYYAVNKEFDPLIANTYPCYSHDKASEYKTIFEETGDLAFEYEDGLISKEDFVFSFYSSVLCPLIMNVAALMLWSSTRLTNKEIVEYVLGERDFISIMIKQFYKDNLKSNAVDHFIRDYVYTSLNNADFRDIVSDYENMTLCEN